MLHNVFYQFLILNQNNVYFILWKVSCLSYIIRETLLWYTNIDILQLVKYKNFDPCLINDEIILWNPICLSCYKCLLLKFLFKNRPCGIKGQVRVTFCKLQLNAYVLLHLLIRNAKVLNKRAYKSKAYISKIILHL